MPLPDKIYELLTYEELRMEVDESMYGITNDPSIVYPWNEVNTKPPFAGEEENVFLANSKNLESEIDGM